MPVSGAFPDARPAHHFILYFHVDLAGNNGFVVVLHIVLWGDAVVDHPLFGQEVSCDRLLQERVTDVLLVRQDLLDGAAMPVVAACSGLDPIHSSNVQLGNFAPPLENWQKSYQNGEYIRSASESGEEANRVKKHASGFTVKFTPADFVYDHA